jgi:hypothetical protein
MKAVHDVNQMNTHLLQTLSLRNHASELSQPFPMTFPLLTKPVNIQSLGQLAISRDTFSRPLIIQWYNQSPESSRRLFIAHTIRPTDWLQHQCGTTRQTRRLGPMRHLGQVVKSTRTIQITSWIGMIILSTGKF